jgi:methylmalonyl-CoA/ethylmalonyl-CoA epimerase
MIIDHIGIVVRSLAEGISHWEKLFGYRQNSTIVTNTRQKVNVVFLSKLDSIMVKLIEPSDETSPIAMFARKGGGIHHICFKSDSVNDSIADLKAQGARLIAAPQPGEAFNNHEIAFLLVPGNLNVELIDTSEKCGWNEPQSDRTLASAETRATS